MPANRKPTARQTQCRLIVLLALLLVIVVGLFVMVVATKGFGVWQDSNTCSTPECVTAASRILQHMDPDADPCQDFYQYACGNFKNRHQMAPGDSRFDSFDVLRQEHYLRLQNILEKNDEKDHDFVLEAKTFHQSCLNEKKIDELGIQPLKDYVERYGGWSVLDENMDFSGENFEDYWAKLGLETEWPGWDNHIFGIGVDADPEKKGDQVILLMQVGLGIGSGSIQNYLKGREDDLVKAYETMMIEVADAMGENSTEYDDQYASTEIQKIVDFEMELAKTMLKPADVMESRTKSRVTNVGELNNLYPGVDWKRLIINLYKRVNVSIDDSTRVKVNAEKFFESVGDLIQKTPLKTLTGYIMWRTIHLKLPFLDSGTRGILRKFGKMKSGIAAEIPRHKYCSKLTNAVFPLVTARLFVDRYFPKSLEGIRKLVQNVKDAFEKRLEKADWLDETSREHAKEKLRAMNVMVGYPDFIEDSMKLRAKLRENGYLKMNADTWFQNAVDTRKKKGEQRLRSLRKPLDVMEWHDPPVTVNAFQFMEMNVMTFPLGILFPPFYDTNNLQASNYAGIGSTIGHEITHGFDNLGRHFDKDGHISQWMTEKSIKNFKEKAKCFQDAYSSYTVEQIGEKVDGELTLGENIADIAGLAEAYDAYLEYVRKYGEEKTLPGIDLSAKQLFFMSHAQCGCGMYTDEKLRLMLRGDSHAPTRERTLGTLYHTKEFADVFKCPVGSGMNPKHKCRVW